MNKLIKREEERKKERERTRIENTEKGDFVEEVEGHVCVE